MIEARGKDVHASPSAGLGIWPSGQPVALATLMVGISAVLGAGSLRVGALRLSLRHIGRIASGQNEGKRQKQGYACSHDPSDERKGASQERL